MGQVISLTAEDGHKLAAYSAMPAGKPKGGVIVVQEIYSVNEHIRSVCDDYAARGYRAIAPAIYDRQQRGAEFGYGGEEIQRIRSLRAGIDWDKTLPFDIAAAIAALRPLRYPAGHGFNCWHRPTTGYDEASATLAVERTLALFERHVAQ